jgi:UDP-glucose 4-epimerase
VVIHLAAQAGVRYSLENPGAYISANIVGTFNILELARNQAPQHLLLASTSSVYGANTKMPFEESDRTDSSAHALRRHQDSHGVDGARLRPSVEDTDHGLSFLQRLRALGAAGHGAVQVHQGDSRR